MRPLFCPQRQPTPPFADDSTSADNSRPSFGVLGQQENKRRRLDDEMEMQSPIAEDPSRRALGAHCTCVCTLPVPLFICLAQRLCRAISA